MVFACGAGGGGGGGALPLVQASALCELCRGAGSACFVGEVRGASAYVFADLGPRHTYTLKVRRGVGAASGGLGAERG